MLRIKVLRREDLIVGNHYLVIARALDENEKRLDLPGVLQTKFNGEWVDIPVEKADVVVAQ